jgi:hypothetical protein
MVLAAAIVVLPFQNESEYRIPNLRQFDYAFALPQF